MKMGKNDHFSGSEGPSEVEALADNGLDVRAEGVPARRTKVAPKLLPRLNNGPSKGKMEQRPKRSSHNLGLLPPSQLGLATLTLSLRPWSSSNERRALLRAASC